MPRGIPHSVFLSWDEDDQDKALALLAIERATCPSCGTRTSDWADDPYALLPVAQRCRGCELIATERESIPKDQRGVHVVLLPAEGVEP